MKKSLALLPLVAVLLAGCGKSDIPPNNLLVPNYLCTQTPTGESRIKQREVYCGKRCTTSEDYKQYSVEVSCKYTEWRNE